MYVGHIYQMILSSMGSLLLYHKYFDTLKLGRNGNRVEVTARMGLVCFEDQDSHFFNCHIPSILKKALIKLKKKKKLFETCVV